MGWEGYHLYQFLIDGIAYGGPNLLDELEAKNARTATLNPQVRGEKLKFIYEYDFGDCEHKYFQQPYRSSGLKTGMS